MVSREDFTANWHSRQQFIPNDGRSSVQSGDRLWRPYPGSGGFRGRPGHREGGSDIFPLRVSPDPQPSAFHRGAHRASFTDMRTPPRRDVRAIPLPAPDYNHVGPGRREGKYQYSNPAYEHREMFPRRPQQTNVPGPTRGGLTEGSVIPSTVHDDRPDRYFIYRGKTKASSESGMQNPARGENSSRHSHRDSKHGQRDSIYSHRDSRRDQRDSRDRQRDGSREKDFPSWVDKTLSFGQNNSPVTGRSDTVSVASENGSDDRSPLHKDTRKRSLSYVLFRVFVIIVIFWDVTSDWLVTTSGPLGVFTGTDDEDVTYRCGNNEILHNKLNISLYVGAVCGQRSAVWTVLAVLALVGSLLTVLQLSNLLLEIIGARTGTTTRVLHAQSEVCLVLVLEVLPQAVTLVLFVFYCECPERAVGDYKFYALMAVCSGAISATLRYVSAFDGVSGEEGCCNNWWRCCCFRNRKYCCRMRCGEMCCQWEIPCVVCCCTLGCDHCNWTPRTWCAPLMKVFSCFCSCCSDDEGKYGVRVLNTMILAAMWLLTAFQISLYILSVS
jgi:hypothetical protein